MLASDRASLDNDYQEQFMDFTKTALVGLVFVAAVATMAFAQQAAAPPVSANPTPGCSVTPAELEANRKVALAFFTTTGDARVALADPSYIQHNPVFKKRAEDDKVTDFAEFKSSFGSAALGPQQGGPGGGGGGARPATGPQPPAGNPFEVVTTECDITIVIHSQYRPDPTTPGRFFEAYTFDAFRVRNGKLVEHWDAAVINPPAAAAGAPAGAN